MMDTSLDPTRPYTLWSGLIGGMFLALAYFGCDQSQVQRYLSGRSLTESRLSLLFNAFLKVPMQFLILLTGVLVFVFFHFHETPLLWNRGGAGAARGAGRRPPSSRGVREEASAAHRERREAAAAFARRPPRRAATSPPRGTATSRRSARLEARGGRRAAAGLVGRGPHRRTT